MTDRPRDSLAALETARLDWQRDDGDLETPHSLAFGDVYFSRQDGRAETEHVFVEGNDLPRRFREWCEPRPFVIGETGFGTGLNVLCAWACFTRHASPDARLHLVSTEKYPLARADLARALAAWPELAEAAARLVDQWPEPVAGVHRLWLDERVTLDLHFGDSAECLAALDGRVDAWFLDGFAPSKNPQMWQPALFEAMSRKSRDGATFATFTCAGVVKRGLKAAGFAWRKVPGFGRKREMLAGEIATAADEDARRTTPWFTPPAPRPARHVAVIGAGLAGASVAHALARRGLRVTLLDREAPGAGASGNAQGALYIKLAVAPNAHSRVYLAGLLHSRRWLETLDPEGALWQQSGVLQLANDSREAERQARFLAQHALPGSVVEGIDATTLAERSGLPPQAFSAARALDYPGAGWVRPQALCQRLAASPGVAFQRGEVMRLTPAGEGWRLTLADGTDLVADQVVIATAQLANRFDQTAELPLQAIRGQVSQVSLPEGMPVPRRVICAGGYVPPPQEGVLTFGASFAPHDEGDEMREADHTTNLAELARTLPGFVEALRTAGAELDPARMDGRAAVRAASPDKLPYAGPVPDAAAWRHDYAALTKDAKRIPDTPGTHHPGLWISAAHGSRGLASAPLCAELIASRICDEPLPLPIDLADQLHPGRRLIRDLIRLTPR
ncbi:tRNA 5-methylaminomethyl-2-thiouridine biosynthesis bifunctional protein [Franzmannia pantelleriensis]|uniref:tRNA 5-methylaminomethyl-2-thiouridine biosynthesis bifunctional protein MnmC n=1 Tax=Franzmannia pantelleriensis TaxID=48727 RepID=A0A1G9Q8G3_9GAMM|nr:bifunctional tRNA (5-methylaminomethyl-2-thiouridine)(34)-methyltransferase MnmD/FAD-dependent 5-carboxymethylaminomethyl-2-thiouridine(34) oxidoreductase MnmC [Halomonas pantelleriensis]SDM06645.1 tRNA 5-methylaminomethyl-2-thiouridine biosynthesis bifunctional protein [Halomonas pantelleriensis]